MILSNIHLRPKRIFASKGEVVLPVTPRLTNGSQCNLRGSTKDMGLCLCKQKPPTQPPRHFGRQSIICCDLLQGFTNLTAPRLSITHKQFTTSRPPEVELDTKRSENIKERLFFSGDSDIHHPSK